MTRISSSIPTVKAATTRPRRVGSLIPRHAKPTPVLAVEVVQLGPLAVPGAGDHEDARIVAGDIGGDDLVVATHRHPPHAGRVTAHGPDVLLGEPDRHAAPADHENVVLAGGDDHRHQLVAFPQVERDPAVTPALVVFGECRLFHVPLLRGEEQIPVRMKLARVNKGLDAFSGCQR